ncbi:hypothetical protein L917_15894 [Phytophthora nicotianae]|uniref:Uncharacterized protein n=1 Tax=Phytophthora nicotianae TaxID=4792 RepID=W2KGH4_PHYNI|nr:hypothetical protein L917_15894 [Phytophthora nicotianae]
MQRVCARCAARVWTARRLVRRLFQRRTAAHRATVAAC